MDGITAGLMLVVGLAGGWLLGARKLAAAREDVARLAAQLEEREKSADREQEVYKTAVTEMEAKFTSLAKQALTENNKDFLEKTRTELRPVKDSLEMLEKRNRAMEEVRAKAYGSLSEQIKAMMTAAEGMSRSSEDMQQLLKGSSQVRGNWGEHLLRNVVEFAGMEEHVHFDLQKTDADGLRPDMVIRLPGGAGIPVDSKCPLGSFQQAREESDPERVRALMVKHAKAVRKHVDDLRRKDYSGALDGPIDFTVMFMPGDHLLESALEVEPTLQDDALQQRILIANPVSLVALLRTVRIYWRQEETDRNAVEMVKASRVLYERVSTFMAHYKGITTGLKAAVKAHNAAVSSFESRVLPAGRVVEELKLPVATEKLLDGETSKPIQIEESVRDVAVPAKKEDLFD